MIYTMETVKGDRKSLYLFSVRNEEELKQQGDSENDINKDIQAPNQNNELSGNTTNDGEECTNTPNDVDNDKTKNQTEADNELNLLKDDLEPKVAENGDKLDDCRDDVSLIDEDENTELKPWNDYDCFIISQENFFPTKVMDLDTQKTIITRFLNFYVGGKVPKGLLASDLLFAVISIIPLTSQTEDLIWHENEYREDGCLFYMTPEQKLNTEFKAIAKKNKMRIKKIKDSNSNVIKSNSSTDKYSENESQNGAGVSKCDHEKTLKCDDENNSDSGDIDSRTNSSDANHDDVSSFISDLKEGISIKWRGSPRTASPSELSSNQYGPVENSAFISSCNKLLIAWHESSEFRIILKWFFGIVALNLMKGIVKGKKNILNTFKTKKFLQQIQFIDSFIKYSPPRESCVDKCCKEMMLRDRHHKVMFAKIIFNSFRIDLLQKEKTISNHYGLYNIFRMCLVDHVAYYDMGIINLLKSIYATVGPSVEFTIILSHLKAEEINVCMEHVRNFITNYMKKEKCLTYHWARYFDARQFEFLSCQNSYATSVMLAVFIEKKVRCSDVWRSGWVRKQQDDLDRYKQLAEQLYEQYKCLCTTKCTLRQQLFSVLEH